MLTDSIPQMLSDSELLDIQTITETSMTLPQNINEFLFKFLFNLLVCWVIVHFFYYKKSKRRDYYFTFLTFSSAMTILLHLMGSVEIGIGLTLGLFAIFGVIRYRTETVPIREMTYLFIIIAIAAVNGLSPVYKLSSDSYIFSWNNIFVTVISNISLILLIWILESERLVRHVATKLIQYDNIQLIVPDKRAELIEDIEKRTGLNVEDIEIGSIDFLKDSAIIKVYYSPVKGQIPTIDHITKINNKLNNEA